MGRKKKQQVDLSEIYYRYKDASSLMVREKYGNDFDAFYYLTYTPPDTPLVMRSQEEIRAELAKLEEICHWYWINTPEPEADKQAYIDHMNAYHVFDGKLASLQWVFSLQDNWKKAQQEWMKSSIPLCEWLETHKKGDGMGYSFKQGGTVYWDAIQTSIPTAYESVPVGEDKPKPYSTKHINSRVLLVPYTIDAIKSV